MITLTLHQKNQRKMKKISVLFLVAGLFCFVSSCKKVEGEGGSSKIVGKVTVKNYNVGGSILEGTYPGSDEDVYIIYGEGNTYYNDRIKTSYDGTFEFSYLQPGTYTIYVYEDVLPEPTNADNKQVVLLTTELGKKETKDVGEIIIKRK